jgi:flagellar biosynthesis chaperone FliJ
MADLIVTSIAVDDAAAQLKLIKDEFENASKNRDDREEIWGHDGVKGAMADFISDWWVKREKLTDNIKDLESKMSKAAETWNETEISLAESLEPEQS